jgi:cob(I)alamin adenosyltransferase
MAIRINRVYTRTGDDGETRLVGGAPVRKDSPRVEAYGTVDELNSVLGLARSFNEQTLAGTGPGPRAARSLDLILRSLQNELFDLGSELATPAGESYPGMIVIGASEVRALEKTIDSCQKDLRPLPSFILPGGGPVAAFLHQARTVCRRAERDVLRLSAIEEVGRDSLRYLNRMSDLLFVLARWIALQTDTPEHLWESGVRLGGESSTGKPRKKKAGSTGASKGGKKKAGSTGASKGGKKKAGSTGASKGGKKKSAAASSPSAKKKSASVSSKGAKKKSSPVAPGRTGKKTAGATARRGATRGRKP